MLESQEHETSNAIILLFCMTNDRFKCLFMEYKIFLIRLLIKSFRKLINWTKIVYTQFFIEWNWRDWDGLMLVNQTSPNKREILFLPNFIVLLRVFFSLQKMFSFSFYFYYLLSFVCACVRVFVCSCFRCTIDWLHWMNKDWLNG